MIGEFLLRVCLLNEERIIYERLSEECQSGDKDLKKLQPKKSQSSRHKTTQEKVAQKQY
jgi:hypothetical protein